jgi:hypothetical protein
MYENVCDNFGYLDIWWRLTKFGQKQPVGTCRLFYQFRQKNTGFDIWKGFGGNLEHPNIWIFEHLNR